LSQLASEPEFIDWVAPMRALLVRPGTPALQLRAASGWSVDQALGEPSKSRRVIHSVKHKETDMGFGKGALLWLIGIPLPIILLLALFMNR
jgi:hypothetical protein